MIDDTSANLAANLRTLREGRGLTQQQCADRAGVPRPTWSTLESGSSNPTLAVLVRVAEALQVSIPELIGPPRAGARVVPARDIPVKRRGGAALRHLLPEPLTGLELDRLELEPGGRVAGVPHTPGTREYLTCERGQVELVASGESFRLGPGDVVIFRGDQRHSYHNPGRTTAVAYSVVALRPA
jgi:transcriptional regulator with XRE-family HTH domain